jgi:hypothetical protein
MDVTRPGSRADVGPGLAQVRSDRTAHQGRSNPAPGGPGRELVVISGLAALHKPGVKTVGQMTLHRIRLHGRLRTGPGQRSGGPTVRPSPLMGAMSRATVCASAAIGRAHQEHQDGLERHGAPGRYHGRDLPWITVGSAKLPSVQTWPDGKRASLIVSPGGCCHRRAVIPVGYEGVRGI